MYRDGVRLCFHLSFAFRRDTTVTTTDYMVHIEERTCGPRTHVYKDRARAQHAPHIGRRVLGAWVMLGTAAAHARRIPAAQRRVAKAVAERGASRRMRRGEVCGGGVEEPEHSERYRGCICDRQRRGRLESALLR